MRQSPDVLVVGGGVIGCAIAYEAAGRGLSVVVAERGAPGGEASGAAAGLLAVSSGPDDAGPMLALKRESLARFAGLAGALRDETGIDVGLEPTGVIEVARTDAEASAAGARLRAREALGFEVAWLDRHALHAEEPHAHADACGGMLHPEDPCVHPARLVDALAAGARRRGAEIVAGSEVAAAGRAGDRITRVRVGRDWLTPGTVVLAAGAWAPRVAGLAPDLDVEPACGQMLALRQARPLCRHVLAFPDGYLIPRGEELWVGATVEHVGFARAVTPEGVRALLTKAQALAPAALDAPVARAWAGLRPWAGRGRPIIGRAPETTNLVLACGHFRSGLLLAPVTAAVVAEALAGGSLPPSALPFAPDAPRR